MKISLSSDDMAQASHLFLGALIVTFPVARWGHGWKPLVFGNIAVLAWAAAKEFWFDVKYEDATTRGSDLKDFVFYVVGLTLADLLIWL